MNAIIFHWKKEEWEEKIAALQAVGIEAQGVNVPSPANLKKIGENPPDVIIIDLGRLPSQGRDAGVLLRQRKTTRSIPLVFVGGQAEKLPAIKELLPDATYTDWPEIKQAVEQAIDNPPEDPVYHDSAFAGYAGKPLADKLGIKEGMTIALVHAPENMAGIIQAPQNCRFIYEQGKECDLSLWFLHSRAELDAQIKDIEQQTLFGPVWMAWQKTRKDFTPDLTQQMVRDAGLANNMVDYKICSIDELWSGLIFKYRKNEYR